MNYGISNNHWKCLRKAYDGGYAIGAFNVNNMEIVQVLQKQPAS